MKGVNNSLHGLKLRFKKKTVVSENVCIAATNDLQLWHNSLCHQKKTHVKEILNKHDTVDSLKSATLKSAYRGRCKQ